MGYTAQQLVAVARQQIGYLEKKTNAGLDTKTGNPGSGNYTKFARDLHEAGYYQANKNGYQWCEVFHDWCHWIASGKDAKVAQAVIFQTGPYGAGCVWSARCYRNAGRFFAEPQVGDQAYFGSKAGEEYHTGIVSRVTDNQVYLIEGNTWGDGGDGVFEKIYDRTDIRILGYGRPDYDATQTETGWKAALLKKGCKGPAVKALQILLIGYGYSCGSAGVDGDFGAGTYAAVCRFQKDRGLTPDGIVGDNTWQALLGLKDGGRL